MDDTKDDTNLDWTITRDDTQSYLHFSHLQGLAAARC